MKAAHRRAHRRIWAVLGLLLPLVIVAGIVLNLARARPASPTRLDVPRAGPAP